MEDIFRLMGQYQGSVDYTLKISMVEIYNEEFKDLLANTGGALERLHTGGARVQLMEDANKGRAAGARTAGRGAPAVSSTCIVDPRSFIEWRPTMWRAASTCARCQVPCHGTAVARRRGGSTHTPPRRARLIL